MHCTTNLNDGVIGKVVADNLRLDAQQFGRKVYDSVLHGLESTAGIVRLNNLCAKGFIGVGLSTLDVCNTHNLVDLVLDLIHCLIRHIQGLGNRCNIYKVNSPTHTALFTKCGIVLDGDQGIVLALRE